MTLEGKPFLEWVKGFPKWLKDSRKKSGLTQIQLAKKVDVSRSFITLLEQGRREPKNALCKKLILFFERHDGKKRTCP